MKLTNFSPVKPQASQSQIRFGLAPKVSDISPLIIENAPEPTQDNLNGFYARTLEEVKAFSRSAVSKYPIGDIVIGESGRAYMGANIEVPRGTYGETVHCEQSAIALARKMGDRIKAMVVGAEPCGPCRQFTLEAGNPELPIYVRKSKPNNRFEQTDEWTEYKLNELLPNPFFLNDVIGVDMFNSKPLNLRLAKGNSDPLVNNALEAAQKSYVIVGNNTWHGVAVKMNDGDIITGSVIESAAFNPSVTAFGDALVQMNALGKSFNDIAAVALVEPVKDNENPGFSYAAEIKHSLKQYAPEATLTVRKAHRLEEE